jgi:hypothetical protein
LFWVGIALLNNINESNIRNTPPPSPFQPQADDVGQLVNVGVICYLKQLLETGFFHADPVSNHSRVGPDLSSPQPLM